MNVFFLIQLSYSQPYHYYFSGNWRNRSISRINLETGISEEFIPDCGIGLQLFVTPDQSRIIYTDRALIYAINLSSLDNRYVLMEKTRGDAVLDLLDAPKTNRIYLMFGDVDEVPKMTVVFNRETFTQIDTLYGIYSYCKPFLSEDEMKIYRLVPDKEGIFFKVFNTSGEVEEEKMRCGDLGDFNFITGIRDSEDGQALIAISYSINYENCFYIVCNLEQGKIFNPIPYTKRSEAYLTPDANHVIIEEVQFIDDDDPNTPVLYRPGNVYVYDAKTAVLKKQLQLLPQGKIEIFENYPDRFYYLPSDSSQPIVNVDIQITQGLEINLLSSQNQLLTNGTLKYYDGGWKEAVNNGDGTFRVETESEIVKLRMTYAYASQDVANVPVNGGPVTFQTIPVKVELRGGQNQFMDEGTVKYYSGGWRTFGTTSGGIAVKELLPNSYKFRLTYAHASNDLTQDIGDNPTVVFQTIPVQIELRDSQSQLIDEGLVKYYAGGWRDFGVTSSGIAVKELLPNSYKFRLTYAHASNDLTQDVGDNETVVFQTVPVQVELRDSQNQLMDEGTVKYYSGGWRTFGNTSGGVVEKELLPNAYKFRMTFAYASNDMTQNVEDNPLVSFQTIQATVELRNSQNQLMDEGTGKYYSGGWRDFGSTTGGITVKELLAQSYKFRINYAYASTDQTQNLSDNETVRFSSIQTIITVKDAQGNLIDGAIVKYYSGGWRNYGTTSGGIVEKELFAKSYKFRATYSGSSRDVIQDVSVNPDVEIVLD